MTKIATVAINAGGVGKSMLIKILGERLARQGKKVLQIDQDSQCSLSESYDIYDTENSVLNIYLGGEVKAREIAENLSIIVGNPLLEDIPLQLRAKGVQNVYFLLEDWLYEHEEFISQYDVVLIDTPPAANTLTLNAIAASHLQIGVVEPDAKSVNAVIKSEEILAQLKNATFDKRRKMDLVTCELVLVANNVKSNEKLSRQLIADIADDDRFICTIPAKSLLTQSTSSSLTQSNLSIWDILEDPKILSNPSHRKFKEKLIEAMDAIEKRLELA